MVNSTNSTLFMNPPNNDHRQWLATNARKGIRVAEILQQEITDLETRIECLELRCKAERDLNKGYAILLFGTLILMGILVSTIATITEFRGVL